MAEQTAEAAVSTGFIFDPRQDLVQRIIFRFGLLQTVRQINSHIGQLQQFLGGGSL